MPHTTETSLHDLHSDVVNCKRCKRLVAHCQRIAREKRKAYQDWEYWGKPVPSLGSLNARVLIVGLAPGAHGANRTGRMFTGDRSGDFLYRALYETGFANQPTSMAADDGLELLDCYVTAPVHCAPPDNKPNRSEFEACQPYLERELELLSDLRAVVVLGGLAHRSYLSILKSAKKVPSLASYPFSHGAIHQIGPEQPIILCSYHPSQQNTQTGRLTADMLRQVFASARDLSGLSPAK